MKYLNAILVFLNFTLCFSACAGWKMISYDGKIVPYSDRPLLITSPERAESIFLDPAMIDERNTIGFIDIGALLKSLIPLEARLKPNELLSIKQSRSYLTLFREQKDPLDFNGRIIIRAHANSKGIIKINYGNQQAADKVSLSLDASTLAKLMINTFTTYNIDVKRIDLQICCDEAGMVTERFFDRFSQNFDNFAINGFRSEVAVAQSLETKRWDFIIQGHDETVFFSEPLTDFMINGLLPDPDSPTFKKYMITKTKGTPEDIPAPDIPPLKTPCQAAPLFRG